MITPVQEVSNWLKKFKDVNGYYPTGEEIEAQLSMSLDKEREAIEQAYTNGSINGSMPLNNQEFTDSSNYYETTYNNDNN